MAQCNLIVVAAMLSFWQMEKTSSDVKKREEREEKKTKKVE